MPGAYCSLPYTEPSSGRSKEALRATPQVTRVCWQARGSGSAASIPAWGAKGKWPRLLQAPETQNNRKNMNGSNTVRCMSDTCNDCLMYFLIVQRGSTASEKGILICSYHLGKMGKWRNISDVMLNEKSMCITQ